ncbi:MAG: magnesium/cobalt transporter CorA [Candidatus Methylomirabilales bacterium]
MIRGLIVREGVVERTVERSEVEKAVSDPHALLWLDLEGIDEGEVQWLGRAFGFHPLALEDCLHRNQRPKIEEYEAYVFAVLHAFRSDPLSHPSPSKGRGRVEELHIFLSHRYLVTVHALPSEPLNRIWERCGKEPELLGHGPSFILHLLSDAIVDAYFPLLNALGEEIDLLEDAVIRSPTRARLNRLFALKKDLILFRKMISQKREVYNALSRREYPFIDHKTALYFRDIYDHLLRASETIESYRDLLGTILEVYLTAISNQLNDVMKRLTIIATIFMPLSFIVGFFGMNFALIPWGSRVLFLLTLLALFVLPIGMLVWFAKRGWLKKEMGPGELKPRRRQLY